EIMPRQIQLETSTQQSGNLGGLLCGFFKGDYALIGRSLQDLIAEPHRHRLIPGFYRAKAAALGAGALGFSISGAGPSVFALCEGEETARKVAAAVAEVFASVPVKATPYVSRINPKGVHVLSEA
ncbi:MAG: homoserine kinase, partial [Verrucomicrobiota bacterium]